MTAFSSRANSFVQPALARIGVGVGEATFVPAAHSLISDYFPPERRATALAIFAIGAKMGTFLASAGGGWIAHNVGWRPAFLLVGLPGLFVAALFPLTVREPSRGRFDPPGSAEPAVLAESLTYLAGCPAFVCIILSAALHGFSSYGSGIWNTVSLMRAHGLNVAQAGLVIGMLSAVVGATGAYAIGRLTDRLGRPTRAAPPRMCALAAAILVFAFNLVGMGIGPLAIGALNDFLAPRIGQEAVRYSLMLAAVPHVLAAVFNALAARSLHEDLERAQRPADAGVPAAQPS
jgi:MFS family permease